MTGDKNQSERFETTGTEHELHIRERAVSRGIAVGRIVCLYGENRQFYRTEIDTDRIEKEIERLRRAFEASRRQLDRLASAKSGQNASSTSAIFASQKLMIEDPKFLTAIEREIRDSRTNSEWAIKLVADQYATRLKGIADAHLRERYIDIYDVSDRMIGALAGTTDMRVPFVRQVVIAAKELRPSTLVELSTQGVVGVITENGGWTSHTFILAREMNLPAVTGVRKLFRKVKTGDTVVVDGFAGEVIVHPNKETLERIKGSNVSVALPQVSEKTSPPPTNTLDGQRIVIYANADSPSIYEKAEELGAEGIGLFRSESLLGRSQRVPSIASQTSAYSAIADAAGEGRVRIRTFDLEVERLIDERSARERNPALGLRAIRLGLTKREVLRQQLRALLLASNDRSIDIVVPMVSGLSEMRGFREALEAERTSLEKKGKTVGKPQIGAMIEVPSAVVMIDEILAETDFVCLGTNDLIQYLLAADRDNESVSSWYRSVHPAVLRSVKFVLEAASRAAKPAIVCGEMAGSPYYVPVLVGLGATSLSMNRNSITGVRKIISGIASEETRELSSKLLQATTVEEVEAKLDEHIRANWFHLFPAGFLDR
ncbi:MAG TPA: phosphoenolpyruvate--protein phosphotransferase [Pyrinomonadaceae bacterium]|nr:phosphoenolpyruvate--protein phosphotransferase [Pyrinomonadaceae bacterium]